MPRFINHVFSLLLVVTLFSCGRIRTPDAGFERVKLERRKTPELVAAMDSMSQMRPTTFYTKIKCEYTDTNQHKSFKTSIRMVKDSALNALITFAAIPIINSLIRPDSVIITNRQDKCVIRKDVNYIKDEFGVSFDYRNIEELFLGLPIGYDTAQRYFQIHDPYHYILSSQKKRLIRREIKGKSERDRNNDRPRREDRDLNEEEVILRYYLANDIKTITRIIIDSPNDSTSIDIQYLSRDSIGRYMIPSEVLIEIVTPRNRLVLSMKYDRSETDQPVDIRFIIPEEYGECKQEEQ